MLGRGGSNGSSASNGINGSNGSGAGGGEEAVLWAEGLTKTWDGIKYQFRGVDFVLKRGERIDQLVEEGRWKEGQSALGLPKVRIKHVVAGKKKKKKTEEEEGEEASEASES